MDMWGRVYSFLFVFLQIFSLSPCVAFDILKQDKFLHVQKPGDVLVSANGVFNAGFYPVGENAFCFSVWFCNSIDPNRTVVWMANRDQPVNGIGSKLELLRNGKLILTDAGRRTEWTVDFVAASPVQLKLLNTGNLVLQQLDGTDDAFLWQSFNSPADTLLPDQVLTKDTYLISSKSRSNYSSGNYKLYFADNNVLRLSYQVPDITSVYWPAPWLVPWEKGSERSTYNSSRVAVLNSSGYFRSSDDLWLWAADLGIGPLRRLTLDPDGNLRLYSLQDGRWIVSWQSISQQCRIHGLCGQNSLCKFDHVLGRTCSCLPEYKIKNSTDWSQGCIAEFTGSYDRRELGFLRLTHVHVETYGYHIFKNYSLRRCKEHCLHSKDCKGFQFKYNFDEGSYYCFPKILLLNGCRTTSFGGDFYLKLPKSRLCSENCSEESRSGCPNVNQTLNRTYEKGKENGYVKVLLWFSTALGIVEFICIFLVWCILFRSNEDNKVTTEEYVQAANRFRRYTYSELKKATKNFTEEIGRGGAGIVYRGALPDQRIAAIKRLHEADQGEAEFLAEVSTIGRLNHMNLIEMWGYCVEGKHRLLVYEYLENGSLADNLSKTALNWARRFEIAISTAKGLAYLHEECLEWILHCDIKPQNVLLDSNFQPKVADFGLSKLLSRGGINTSSFSSVRGTRGYMAPEWVYNLPITSKVDVYSYGIVVLEMLTGKSSTGVRAEGRSADLEQGQERLVPWAREKINGATSAETWIEEVADPMLGKDYDIDKMKLLIEVALQCVQEDMHARPTMSQVVHMLSLHDNEASQYFQGP
ncbi:hypothetical protein SLE2022_078950 [Rubroshorea leprosula]